MFETLAILPPAYMHRKHCLTVTPRLINSLYKHFGYFNHISVISVACVLCTHLEVQEMLLNKSESEDLEIIGLLFRRPIN